MIPDSPNVTRPSPASPTLSRIKAGAKSAARWWLAGNLMAFVLDHLFGLSMGIGLPLVLTTAIVGFLFVIFLLTLKLPARWRFHATSYAAAWLLTPTIVVGHGVGLLPAFFYVIGYARGEATAQQLLQLGFLPIHVFFLVILLVRSVCRLLAKALFGARKAADVSHD